MKRCPNCQRTYPDDAPGFCVNDGTQLVTEEAPAYDPQKTILASPPPPAAPPPQYNPAPPQAPPPSPQQGYQPPNEAAGIKPPTGWQPQPPQAQPPAAAPWPPPPPQQQGQWGGGYYQQPGQQPYGAPYGAPAAGQGKGLSLATFITGIVSVLALTLIFLMAGDVIDRDRDVAEICFYGSAALGLVAVVLGVLALISKKQRSKWMAIVGMILGVPAIIFFLYVMFAYNSFI